VVRIGNTSVAFHWRDLLKESLAQQSTPEGTVTVNVKNFVPAATRKDNGEELNGYFTYWFSWYAMYGEKGVVWGK